MTISKRIQAAAMLMAASAGLNAQFVPVPLDSHPADVPAPQMVSAASGTAPVSAGSIVSIYGADFANGATSATTLPLPVELGGVSANFTVLDILNFPVFSGAMPLFYVSPTQINARVPADAVFQPCNAGSGSVYFTHLQITTPSGGQTATVSATPAPAWTVHRQRDRQGRGGGAVRHQPAGWNADDYASGGMSGRNRNLRSGSAECERGKFGAGAVGDWHFRILDLSAGTDGDGRQSTTAGVLCRTFGAICGAGSNQRMDAVEPGRERDGEPERDADGNDTGRGLYLFL